MNGQTTEPRKRDYGWWISLIVLSTLVALQIGVIAYSAITGETAQTKTHQAAPSR